ncbi:MAG TPA: acyl carrier protein [Candidatus Limicola stercorigallinarum]|nr:acyl carrier protein [Candidatus Limicola stercorigallinarum]
MDFEKMREVIAETVGCDLEKVTREAELEADLGADSLAAMELVMALEEAFDIEVDDSALDQFKTVGDLADYVAEKTA